MLGAICKRDILAHPVVTVRCFGWVVFVRAVCAGANTTFLSLLAESPAMRPPRPSGESVLDECIALERRIGAIYAGLAERLAGEPAVAEFLRNLAAQEEGHAELLTICRDVFAGDRWEERLVDACRPVVRTLALSVAGAERRVAALSGGREALELVLELESTEVNRVFRRVVTTHGSPFVQRLGRFQAAGREHTEYVRDVLVRLLPDLAVRCQQVPTAWTDPAP